MDRILYRLKTDRKFLLFVVGLLWGLFSLPYLTIPGIILWYFFKKSTFSKKIKIFSTAVIGGLFTLLITVSVVAYAKDPVAQLTVTEPIHGYVTEGEQVVIKGTYTPSDRKIWINSKQITALNGSFETTYELSEGENRVSVEAGDWKRTKVVLTIVRSKPTSTAIPEEVLEEKPQVLGENSSDQQQEEVDLEYAKVIKVVDGDTIQIEGGKTVRYIGIDTPETVDPRRAVQCYGKEASNKNKELVEGAIVGLQKDVSETDKYGRLLRYVYKEGVMINLTLVSEGYAYARSYPPDIQHQDTLRAAEQEARNAGKGLWSACQLSPTPTAKPRLQPTSVPVPTTKPQLKPTTPPAPEYQVPPTHSGTTNVTSPTRTYTGGDKDCGDFGTQAEAQAFFISQGGPERDSHRLDRDKDGIACEDLP